MQTDTGTVQDVPNADAAGEKNGALSDIRVLELGSMLAGPFCGQILSDHGAEVIKVEAPGPGDSMRVMGRGRIEGRGLWWPHIARGKRSITLDLRVPEGQALALDLAEKCDVVVENFRPGTLEKWNLGYEQLSARRPDIILTRVSGYGQTGPYRERAGFGGIAEAMGGLRHVTGYPDEAPPRVGIGLGDQLAGMFAAIGTLSALHERERSGKGQVVDVAIYEAVAALMESTLADYSRLGIIRNRTGSTLPGFAPSNIYKTREGVWFLIGANANNPFRRLCEVMGRPELADDPRFATDAARADHSEEIDQIVADWVAEHGVDELEKKLHEAGVPAGKIYDAPAMLEDPQFKARELIRWVSDETLGDFAIPGVVPKLSRTPGDFGWIGRPRPGHDNVAVYGELLGLTPQEVGANQAIVGSPKEPDGH